MIGTILAFASAALLATFLVLWQLAIRRVSIAQQRGLVNATIWSGMLLALVALAMGSGKLGGWLAGLTLFVGGAYTFLYLMAGQSRQVPAIATGERLPDFSAPDEQGDRFELSSLAGHPVLLKLFRGHW